MIELPLGHYRHLKRLADLRRCSLSQAVEYLFAAVEADPGDWIDEHVNPSEEVRRLNACGRSAEDLMDRIQGLPRNIRPVTDGPYLDRFDFFSSESGLLGIEADGVRVLDFEKATLRDINVFALVKDLLPPMTVEQYRVYNTFNSQYLRLVREPHLFTMPDKKAPAIDVGCYVGHKALALAQFVGGAEVLAFEMVEENVHVLEQNARNNPQRKIRPIHAALSDRHAQLAMNTRNEQSMAHSLAHFNTLKEANTSLLSGGEMEISGQTVSAVPLDDFTRSYDEISALHISVNGYEPEVTMGARGTIRKSDIVRISCPYRRDDAPIFDLVVKILRMDGIEVFGRSGAAVIAGKRRGHYHARPIAAAG